MTPPTVPTPVYNSRFATGGDTVLRTSDDVLFSVHKANLSALSSFFRDMFRVGSAQLLPESEPITISESAAVIEVLLQTCYPVDDGTPPLDFAAIDNTLLLDVYEATVTYQMWLAGLALRSFVEPLIERDPFLVIKLAHKLNDTVMLNSAVEATLKVDILSDPTTFRVKTGILWPNVLEYHFRTHREIARYFSTVPKITHYCGCANCLLDESKLYGGWYQGAWTPGSADFVVAALKRRRDDFGSVICSNFNSTLNQLRADSSWPPALNSTVSFQFSALIP